jgi:hypothetical protein
MPRQVGHWSGNTIIRIAAYIEDNPVKAGLVQCAGVRDTEVDAHEALVL